VKPAVIALLRAVNVMGRRKIKMDTLRSLCEACGLESPRTYLQSGNVVFRCKEKDQTGAAERLEAAIEAELGFRPEVILRTAVEWNAVVAANPFAGRAGVEPAKLQVVFLAGTPGKALRDKLPGIIQGREELYAKERELYIHYRDGIGSSKLTPALLEKTLQTPGTARNWNTVLAMHQLATDLAR
jgi:uncharacterized protein (DUF1697 family)